MWVVVISGDCHPPARHAWLAVHRWVVQKWFRWRRRDEVTVGRPVVTLDYISSIHTLSSLRRSQRLVQQRAHSKAHAHLRLGHANDLFLSLPAQCAASRANRQTTPNPFGPGSCPLGPRARTHTCLSLARSAIWAHNTHLFVTRDSTSSYLVLITYTLAAYPACAVRHATPSPPDAIFPGHGHTRLS